MKTYWVSALWQWLRATEAWNRGCLCLTSTTSTGSFGQSLSQCLRLLANSMDSLPESVALTKCIIIKCVFCPTAMEVILPQVCPNTVEPLATLTTHSLEHFEREERSSLTYCRQKPWGRERREDRTSDEKQPDPGACKEAMERRAAWRGCGGYRERAVSKPGAPAHEITPHSPRGRSIITLTLQTRHKPERLGHLPRVLGSGGIRF